MFVASSSDRLCPPFGLLLPALIAITAGCAGCNAITCYLDRDIDSVMSRTLNRPLPSKRIHPPEKGLYFGIFLITIFFWVALSRNLLSFTLALLGVFDNVIIYSILSKRKNSLNVILGGFGGAIPVLFGYVYLKNNLSITPILMASLVFLWIPNHIWSLSFRFGEEYRMARIPMLPNLVEERNGIKYIVLTSILLTIFSFLLFFLDRFGLVYCWFRAF